MKSKFIPHSKKFIKTSAKAVIFILMLLSTGLKAQTCAITYYNNAFCYGAVNQLCAPANGMYLWSTGETSQCITMPGAGTYSLTVTFSNGVIRTCSKTMLQGDTIACSISSNNTNCSLPATTLCAPSGLASYLWSTGASTSCITVTNNNFYNVRVTNTSGCIKTCPAEVNCAMQSLTCKGNPDKVPVCHFTGSNKNPFHQICVNRSSMAGHLNNHHLDYVGYCITRLEDARIINGDFPVSAYPNPARDQFTIAFTSAVNDTYELVMADLTGRVLIETNGMLQESDNQLNFSVKGFKPGMYNVKLKAGERSVALRIMITD